MPSIVVPFHAGKTRLPPELQTRLSLAMLADVLAACAEVGRTVLVTDDQEARELAETVHDAGRGQGAAVEAGLAAIGDEQALVVNADLPCLTASDLRELADAVPLDGLAVAPAADGTTNALGLSRPELFAPLYGPGSAEEFRAHASQLGVPSAVVVRPGLADDVDTLADLERLADRVGAHTRTALGGVAA
jgi:2-phospho-L-lactate/phosphoenolpyruvate guanylyltransferase